MILLQLSSSNTDFQTLNFNRGLNIVLGEKASNNRKETFNGIGKTLSLSLIKYMLGGGISSCLKEIIKDDEFTLVLKHNEKPYEIRRKNDEIYLDDKPYDTQKEFKADLDKIFLTDNILTNGLTFNGLLSRFSRNNDDAYVDTISQVTKSENGFLKNTYNSYLLGLDVEYVTKKNLLITERENLKTIQKQLKELGDVNENDELLDIEEEITQLTKDLSTFQIAEDYYSLTIKANSLTNDINIKRNHLFRNKKIIENKKKSLETTPDIEVDIIKKLYSEVEFFFSDIVNKRLEDVENFHKTLLKNRQDTFFQEIKALEIANKILIQEIDNLDKERANTMLYLENKGAFEEYTSLAKRLEELKESKAKVLRYQNLQTEFQQQELDTKLKIDTLNKDVYEYFLKNTSIIENIKKEFRNIVKYIYKTHSGSIDITINTNIKAHKIYDIAPKIYADGSRGINEVKIFAYDLLLYKLNPNLFSFLAHDSILYDNIDPRQIASAFELILKEISDNNLQYFTSINENIFSNFMETIDDEDTKQTILNSIILQLSEKNKLFKTDFDC